MWTYVFVSHVRVPISGIDGISMFHNLRNFQSIFKGSFIILYSQLLGAGLRNSTRGKGHEGGGSAYAKAGSSLRSPPGNSRASTPKTSVCLLSAFSPTPLTLWGAVPHYLSLKKELAYSSS